MVLNGCTTISIYLKHQLNSPSILMQLLFFYNPIYFYSCKNRGDKRLKHWADHISTAIIWGFFNREWPFPILIIVGIN